MLLLLLADGGGGEPPRTFVLAQPPLHCHAIETCPYLANARWD
ncbi:hypothetical protein JMJ77_0002529 [Colletotrichum scovillei]|uniref:Uncharacterized protein n=1 Tax=Colletotrichum scovillei TaxID=1209932 RepID=A0A9P7UGN5_9PEZI|nr:hypothetical protein JMJ77_0002529 [Colletotrichum scovillei]KAG7070951.1 hypothetical protein JMJ76_0002192 [Colletotrichum scovillei]KAG7079231.1 hypothetical protein JMJ78_0002887 [Colletotrichum scovillei]